MSQKLLDVNPKQNGMDLAQQLQEQGDDALLNSQIS